MNAEFEALLNSTEKNRKKKKYFPDYWLCRNYKQDRAYELAEQFFLGTVSEDVMRLISCETAWKLDFWLARGYSLDEAVLKQKETQSRNSNRVSEKYTKEERRCFRNTTLEFYIERGFTESEAQEQRKERQKTFSLKKCVERFGEEEGLRIFKERQTRWRNTLDTKSDEEKESIRRKQGITLKNYVAKYGETEGPIKYHAWVIDYKKRLTRNSMKNYSDESIEWFKSFIPEDILKHAKFGEDEHFILDSDKVFFYDFRYNNVIIEYHGHMYHYNPRIPNENWRSPFGIDIESSLQKDKCKRELAESNGFIFFEYYSNDSKEHESNLKQEILKALNEKTHN